MIFTESTIKISNNVSKMDSTIVLYRGDKNVEIRFTILQSPFKYSNTVATNVIESTNASYGQLVIKTPNDKPPIFSEVSATKEGTVLFTITKEMIDEIEELGVYTFQIRLMDENKQSRVTIPPVENGIEIKEPIAIEDDNTTNVVGLAKANYAVATSSDVNTPTFDDNGKYNKTNWNDGDIITNTSLNKIEDGIYTTNENVTATKKYVDDKMPLTEDSDKYIFKKTITKTINFNDPDIIITPDNFPSVIKNLEITNELSGKEILGVKIESDDGISCVNDVKEYYLNGSTLIINNYTTKDANGKVIQFIITFNRKVIKNNEDIQYEENKDYCTFAIRSKESGKHPLNDYNRSKIWTVTFTYYDDNPNYYTVLYKIPTNIENGSSKGSIQQTGNVSTGVFALGNKNTGKGYLLGASNSSENASCIFGKGNKGIGTTPGYIIGEGNASHGTGGGLTFGSGNTVEGTTVAVGRKLNTNAPKENNRGAMIIGQGGTLADDTRFAISTSNTDCTETRYPFEAKEDGSTYLRGKNVLLETENGIVEDNAIVNKKYVDDKVSSLPQISFNENGELVVTINGVSKTFVPKNV